MSVFFTNRLALNLNSLIFQRFIFWCVICTALETHIIRETTVNQHNLNETGSTVSNTSKKRRTFLKRASAGVVIASIPGRSAWAGISGSIVASGHGSDFEQGISTVLLDACQVKSYISGSFQTYFVDKDPINGIGNLSVEVIFDGGDPDLNNVNTAILVMLFNAENNGLHGIQYSVLSQHNDNLLDFANYLHNQASADPSGVANLLWDTISKYSSTGISTICPSPSPLQLPLPPV